VLGSLLVIDWHGVVVNRVICKLCTLQHVHICCLLCYSECCCRGVRSDAISNIVSRGTSMFFFNYFVLVSCCSHRQCVETSKLLIILYERVLYCIRSVFCHLYFVLQISRFLCCFKLLCRGTGWLKNGLFFF